MLDYDRLIRWREPELAQRYTERDTMLYGLGVGFGQDPTDERELRFVYERGLQAVPSMASVLASPWGWLYRAGAGVTASMAMHGDQGLVVHRPLPPRGTVVSALRVTDVQDKGRDKGAVVHFERQLHEQASGDLLCTVTATMFCRADGGFSEARDAAAGAAAGGASHAQVVPDDAPPVRATAVSAPADAPPADEPDPDEPPARETLVRAPDAVCEFDILPQAALMFRLHGDTNPIHADPALAARAGFPRPVLHGLCSYGMAARAILASFCDYDASRLRSLGLRFSAPVFPGDRLRFSLWRAGGEVRFAATVPARRATVLTRGYAAIGPAVGPDASEAGRAAASAIGSARDAAAGGRAGETADAPWEEFPWR